MTKDQFEYEFKWFKDDFDTSPEKRGRLFTNRSAMEEARSNWEPCVKLEPALHGSLCPDARVGIVITGEWVPASGTHNVIIGIVRHIVGTLGGSVLGFLGGPQGFARGHFVALTLESVAQYLNQGGCDMLGFGSLRAIGELDFVEIRNLAQIEYNLTALVFVGGPKELGHVAQLIQHPGSFPTVVSVFQSPNANISSMCPTLGFHSASCALAEYVGNIAKEDASSKEFPMLHLVRSGSTITTMEVALQVGPAYAVLSEEKIPIFRLVDRICEIISNRFASQIKQSLVLVSDNFFRNLPHFVSLQLECRAWYQKEPTFAGPYLDTAGQQSVHPELLRLLSSDSRLLLETFGLADQLRLVRAYDSDGNPTMPETPPEEYLGALVGKKISKISVRTHALEIRCPLPTDFDCAMGLALGCAAGQLAVQPAAHGSVVVAKLLETNSWSWEGVPLLSLLTSSSALPSNLPLSEQYGGAHQELINLARQRVEREATVPQIRLRLDGSLLQDDPFYLRYSRVRVRDALAATCRQPGPVQLSTNQAQVSPMRLPELLGNRIVDSDMSQLQQERLLYKPRFPQLGSWREAAWTSRRASRSMLQLVFPFTNAVSAVMHNVGGAPTNSGVRVGVVFLGRQTPGCQNVIFGLKKIVKSLVGIRNGSFGLVNNISRDLTDRDLPGMNQSGIALLGRSDTVLNSREDLVACANTCKNLRLDGLVVVGGIGTHADTALLGEVLFAQGVPTRLIGVPASVRNDIPLVEQSLGHDTVCQVVGSLVGSLATLAASSKRQWCFVRVSGGSHVLAQVAVATHANLVLIAEEITAGRMSLKDIVKIIADLVTERALAGLDFGIILFPENVANSNKPELVLQSLVSKELQRRKMFSPSRSGSFVSSTHCIGAEARSSLPSTFDCDLGFTMGCVAGSMIAAGKSGLMVNIGNLAAAPERWVPSGIPLTSLLTVEKDVSSPVSCLVSIAEKSAKVGFCLGLPRPSLRRFKAPGPVQFLATETSLGVEDTLVSTSSQLPKDLARLMYLAATASDESVRRVIQSGLDYALAVGAEEEELRGSSHCRVVQIVPILGS